MAEARQSVLVIAGELQTRSLLAASLEQGGFVVGLAETGRKGLTVQAAKPSDLVIVELLLPDMDGHALIAQVRVWSRVPIIAVSMNNGDDEKVRALDLGADDCIAWPCSMVEMLARVRARFRAHAGGHHSSGHGELAVITVGPVSIDLANRLVMRGGTPVAMTPKEYRMLQILAQNAGRVVTQQHILREIWGTGHDGDAHYLRILVKKIRQKIEADPVHPGIVLTEPGVGYRLAVPRARDA
ncbi:MAG: winged helix-turn-helix domain-containing protein [Hyphomicrobiaceae bacterium]